MEQKNGSIVRQIVGYDRFEGELAYHQLAELYRALRLYVNVFQPSLKLHLKRREGSRVYRRYDAARTPVQRLLAAAVLDEASRTRLVALAEALDPVQALRQLHLGGFCITCIGQQQVAQLPSRLHASHRDC